MGRGGGGAPGIWKLPENRQLPPPPPPHALGRGGAAWSCLKEKPSSSSRE